MGDFFLNFHVSNLPHLVLATWTLGKADSITTSNSPKTRELYYIGLLTVFLAHLPGAQFNW